MKLSWYSQFGVWHEIWLQHNITTNSAMFSRGFNMRDIMAKLLNNVKACHGFDVLHQVIARRPGKDGCQRRHAPAKLPTSCSIAVFGGLGKLTQILENKLLGMVFFLLVDHLSALQAVDYSIPQLLSPKPKIFRQQKQGCFRQEWLHKTFGTVICCVERKLSLVHHPLSYQLLPNCIRALLAPAIFVDFSVGSLACEQRSQGPTACLFRPTRSVSDPRNQAVKLKK